MAESKKTELQFYVELIEEKLEGLSPYFPFSLAYAARTPRIGIFIELIFKDQGFNIVRLDCASLYPADDSDIQSTHSNSNSNSDVNTNTPSDEKSEEPDNLSQALDNLRAQCAGLDKPVIMLENVEALKRSERYDNQMVSLLTEGMKLNDEQYIPVIITSTRAISSSYTNHVNQSLNFKYHMIDDNKRVKKIYGSKEDDELLAALLDNGQNPYETKLKSENITSEKEKEDVYQKMTDMAKKYQLNVWETGKSALMKNMKDIKIDVKSDFLNMSMPVIPQSFLKMKHMPTFSSDFEGEKTAQDLGLNFVDASGSMTSDIHPPVKSDKENKDSSVALASSITSHKSQGSDWQSVTIQKLKDKAINHSYSFSLPMTVDFEKEGLSGLLKPGLNKDVEDNILKLKDVFLNGGKNSQNISSDTNASDNHEINQDNSNKNKNKF